MVFVLCCTAALVSAAIQEPGNEADVWKLLDAAEEGDAESQNGLGMMHVAGSGVEQSDAKAVEWFQKAADQGHPEALFNLGACYGNGVGVDENTKEAARYFEKAAERGHAQAAFSLGSLYYTGALGKKNMKKTLEYYQKAAEAGDVDGLYNLGTLYFNKEGVKQDEARALKLWAKASKKGHGTAGFSIFEVFEMGTKETPKNPKKAQEWLFKAADNGHARALAIAGQRLVGMGEIPRAVDYLRRAAEQDDHSAMFFLGVLLAEGRAEMRSKEEAWKMWEGAAKAGNDVATKVLEKAETLPDDADTRNLYLQETVRAMKGYKKTQQDAHDEA